MQRIYSEYGFDYNFSINQFARKFIVSFHIRFLDNSCIRETRGIKTFHLLPAAFSYKITHSKIVIIASTVSRIIINNKLPPGVLNDTDVVITIDIERKLTRQRHTLAEVLILKK